MFEPLGARTLDTLIKSSVATTDRYYTPLMIEDVIQIHHKHTPIRVFEEAK